METKTMMTSEQRIAQQLNESKQMQDRQLKAAEGDENAVRMITANRDSKSKIKETDKDRIHVAVVTRNLDAENKVFHNEARILKIQPRMWPQMIANSAFAAFDEAKVIHDPRPNAPKDEVLKPAPAPAKTSEEAKVNDAALAAREQKIKDAEKSLDAKLEELKKLMAQQQQAAKPAQAPESDLPPLPDNLGEKDTKKKS